MQECLHLLNRPLRPVGWATNLGFWITSCRDLRIKMCGSRFQAEFSGCVFLIEVLKEMKSKVLSEYKISPLTASI